MCNFDRVAGFLIGAKVAYIAMIAFLVAAAVASGGIFSAGGAVGFMVGAIASLAVATGLFIAALVDIESCRGPCDTELADVRAQLIATIAFLATILVMLVVLAIVAPVPVAGAVAVSGAVAFLTVGSGVLITIESLLSIKLAIAIANFNTCQVRNSTSNNSTLAVIFAILTGFGALGGLVVGVASGGLWSAGIGLLAAGALFGFDVKINVDTGKGDDKDG